MFENINFSKLKIKKHPPNYGHNLHIRAEITLKEHDDDSYQELVKVNYYCHDHGISRNFHHRRREEGASILPQFRDRIEREKIQFSEAKAKAIQLLNELDSLGDILDIDFKDFGCDSDGEDGLGEIVKDIEYDIPLEYLQEIWNYRYVSLEIYFKEGSEVYHFFKELN